MSRPEHSEIHREPSTQALEPPTHFPPLPPATAPLWIGMLATPAIWTAQYLFTYAFAPKIVSRQREIVVHVSTIAALIIAIATGLLSLHYWHQRGHKSDADASRDDLGRVRFTAWLGMASSVLYGLAIIAHLIATYMLDGSVF